MLKTEMSVFLVLLSGCQERPGDTSPVLPDTAPLPLDVTLYGPLEPSAVEECDGEDNDGDGEVDEGFDADGDGIADCHQCSVSSTDEVASGESDSACEPREPGGEAAWSAELLWDLTLDANNSYRGGCSHTLIADLNSDDIGDILCQNQGNRFLYAVDGASGEVMWEFSDIKHLNPTAIADVDQDGALEIVLLSTDDRLIYLTEDGEIDQESTEPLGTSLLYPDCQEDSARCDYWDPLLVEDLDRDGSWEVVTTSAILDAETMEVESWLEVQLDERVESPSDWVLWTLNAADLDGDGLDEVIVASSAYSRDGELLWSVTLDADALSAHPQETTAIIVDADEDDAAEVVFLGLDEFVLVDGDGTILQTTSTQSLSKLYRHLSNEGLGCAGDLDSDGITEIVIPNRHLDNEQHEAATVSAWELDGTLLWSRSYRAHRGLTSCHVFDFDGDGVDEVIFSDADGTLVVNGQDGSERLTFPALYPDDEPSNIPIATPIVADLDNDGSVELVIGRGYEVDDVPSLEVYGNPDGLWPTGGRIWPSMSWSGVGMDVEGGPQPELSEPVPDRFRGQAQAHVDGVDVQPVLHDACEAEAEVRLSVGAENLGPDNLTSKLAFTVTDHTGAVVAEGALLKGVAAGATTETIELVLTPDVARDGLIITLSTPDAHDCNPHNNAIQWTPKAE